MSTEPYCLIIVDSLAIFPCRAKIGLMLPVISNFVPVGYEWNVEEHVAPKYCHTWRGFNSLTAIGGPDRQLFFELHARVVSPRIFVRSHSLIAR